MSRGEAWLVVAVLALGVAWVLREALVDRAWSRVESFDLDRLPAREARAEHPPRSGEVVDWSGPEREHRGYALAADGRPWWIPLPIGVGDADEFVLEFGELARGAPVVSGVLVVEPARGRTSVAHRRELSVRDGASDGGEPRPVRIELGERRDPGTHLAFAGVSAGGEALVVWSDVRLLRRRSSAALVRAAFTAGFAWLVVLAVLGARRLRRRPGLRTAILAVVVVTAVAEIAFRRWPAALPTAARGLLEEGGARLFAGTPEAIEDAELGPRYRAAIDLPRARRERLTVDHGDLEPGTRERLRILGRLLPPEGVVRTDEHGFANPHAPQSCSVLLVGSDEDLAIFDPSGRDVRTRLEARCGERVHQVHGPGWNGANVRAALAQWGARGAFREAFLVVRPTALIPLEGGDAPRPTRLAETPWYRDLIAGWRRRTSRSGPWNVSPALALWRALPAWAEDLAYGSSFAVFAPTSGVRRLPPPHEAAEPGWFSGVAGGCALAFGPQRRRAWARFAHEVPWWGEATSAWFQAVRAHADGLGIDVVVVLVPERERVAFAGRVPEVGGAAWLARVGVERVTRDVQRIASDWQVAWLDPLEAFSRAAARGVEPFDVAFERLSPDGSELLAEELARAR